MRSNLKTTFATYSVLALAGAVPFTLPDALPSMHAAGPLPRPPVQRINGIVRDFYQAHPDMQSMPAGGMGHVAGLVDATLGGDGDPVFVGPGSRVLGQATDSAGRNIAPHLANMTCGSSPLAAPPIAAMERVRIRNTSRLDSYDSSFGSYGGANVGAGAIVSTNSTAPGMLVLDNSSVLSGDAYVGPGGDPASVADIQGTLTGGVGVLPALVPMPVSTMPAGLPPYAAADLDIGVSLSVTIDQDHHVDTFRIQRGASVTIDGDVTIFCEQGWIMDKGARLAIPDGSSLRIFARSRSTLGGPGSVANPDTSGPDKLEIHMLGSDPDLDRLDVQGLGSRLCARVYAPDTTLDLDQSAEFSGTFVGAAVEIDNQSQVHVDMRDYGGVMIGGGGTDTQAALGATPDDGAVTSSATFDQWFNDVPGVNMSGVLPVILVQQADDSYRFDTDVDPDYSGVSGFYPIEHALLGNEGMVHNYFFTYELKATFTYDASAGLWFKYTGSGDAWVFIGDDLAIDLGSVHGVMDQRIDLDRLCLVDGRTYWLSFFTANRYKPHPRLRIDTNIVFTGSNLPTISAAFD
jgi:fibro-slime domain-containing protein